MIKKLFIALLACLVAGVVISSCNKPSNANQLPAPPPSSGEESTTPDPTPDPTPPGWDAATHCSDIGQTPIILTYFTEYNATTIYYFLFCCIAFKLYQVLCSP